MLTKIEEAGVSRPRGPDSSAAHERGQERSHERGQQLGAAGRFQSPLYHQILLILKQRIVEGALRPGDIVPGEQELAEIYGVSRVTAKRALDELASAGLVKRERGRGTRVLPGAVGPQVLSGGAGDMDPLLAMGGSTAVRVLECERIEADPHISEQLEIEPGTPVLRAVRVRSTDQGPFSHLTTYVPGWAATFEDAALGHISLLELLERAGIRPVSAVQDVSVTLADPVVAERMGVDVGAPLMRKQRIVRDGQGRPIEMLDALYRCDRYRMTMTLNRREDETESDLSAEWRTETISGAPGSGTARNGDGLTVGEER
jgi:GntR family transcriptional regulator